MNSHGVTNVLVAFHGARNAGPTASGVADAVPVCVEVVDGVCVRSGVPRGRHATYAGALHSPGCSSPPTQQSQQGDADAGHRRQSYCPAGSVLCEAVGDEVAVEMGVPLPDALSVPVGEELAEDDDVDGSVTTIEADGELASTRVGVVDGDADGSRVGVKDGEPTGCVHAMVTWP